MSTVPKGFLPVNIDDYTVNPFTEIGKEWMLVTAGTMDSWNTMTAAWGGIGFLWNKPVVYAFVRYSRYTYEFMEKSSHFTCTFFDRSWRKALNLCGTKSGRDTDKAAETGLIPIALDSIEGVTGPAVGFQQAKEILTVKKLYSGEMSPEDFSVDDIHRLYPKKDYHRMYVGSVESILRSNTNPAE